MSTSVHEVVRRRVQLAWLPQGRVTVTARAVPRRATLEAARRRLAQAVVGKDVCCRAITYCLGRLVALAGRAVAILLAKCHAKRCMNRRCALELSVIVI